MTKHNTWTEDFPVTALGPKEPKEKKSMAMDFLKEIKKINDMADFIDDSTMGNIPEYISTGSLALNGILSGDLFKGIPAGRVTGFMGKSGTGKSFLTARICKEAQLIGYDIVWFETENATDKFFLQRLGVDTSRVIIIPVYSVEEFRNQTVKVIELFEKAKEEKTERKLLIVLDSLGNLPIEKELKDADEGKHAQDMGTRAKVIRSLSRVLTMKLAINQIPMVVVNHTYTNASGYVPIEVPSGGEGVIYISSIIALLTKSAIKEEITAGGKTVTGNILKARTSKNRVVPEGKIAEIKVDFEEGVDKYYGLLDWAVAAGLMEKQSTTYLVKHLNKKYFESKIYIPEVWEPILTELNTYVKNNVKFSSVSDGLLKTALVEGVEEVEAVDGVEDPSITAANVLKEKKKKGKK